MPDGIDPVGAATIPAAALTARLAFDWAKLKPGDRVLIHAASGGVGLAAIQLARHHGATVFATASTYKRATLREMGVEYVYDSRTTDFADQILADTDGDGVDVVLNSLTNDGFVEATVRATAKGGRFAEIAKRDIWTPEQMAAVRPDIDYEIVALDVTMMTDPDHIQRLMARGVRGAGQGRVDTGARRGLPADRGQGRVPPHAAGAAHRQDRGADAETACSRAVIGAIWSPAVSVRSDCTQRLIWPSSGAGDIVLTSRRAPDAEAEQAIAAIMERFHCRVHVFSADVGDESEVAELLARIRAELPPLAGVAHLAGVLDDALLPQQDLERFRTTLRAQGLWRTSPAPVDQGRRSRLLHPLLVGVGRAGLAVRRPTTRPPTRCSTGSSPIASRRACRRLPSTSARGAAAVWPVRRPRWPISAPRA